MSEKESGPIIYRLVEINNISNFQDDLTILYGHLKKDFFDTFSLYEHFNEGKTKGNMCLFYNQNKLNSIIMPCFIILENPTTVKYIWVSTSLRKKGIGRIILNLLGIKNVINVTKSSAEFWKKIKIPYNGPLINDIKKIKGEYWFVSQIKRSFEDIYNNKSYSQYYCHIIFNNTPYYIQINSMRYLNTIHNMKIYIDGVEQIYASLNEALAKANFFCSF